MSLNVLKEFMIHFHSFRNIDLLNQGLYQIRTRIFYTDKTTRYSAMPYHYADSKENENSFLSEENTKYNIISNHIGENNIDYVTKTFAIRYSDEEVDIDEFCYYRMEIPFEKHKSDISFTVEVSLFFSDSYLNLIKDKNKDGHNSLEFKCAGIQILSIRSSKQGYIESYTPIIYTDNFSSLLNCSLHVINLDYKLRTENICLFVVEEVDNQQQVSSQAYATKKSGNDKILNINDNYNTNSSVSNSNSIGQFLLDMDGKPLPALLGENIIDEIYKKYVVSLVEVYLFLKNNYFKLLKTLLDDKMKSEFSFFTIVQPLFIYYDENDKETIDSLNEEVMITSLQFPSKFLNLSKRIKDYCLEYVSCRILIEINFISSQIHNIWHKYIEMIRYFPLETNFILSNEFYSKYKENLSMYLKRSIVNVTETANLLIPIEINIADLNKTNALEHRKFNMETLKPDTVEISCSQIKTSNFPILFEENYIRQANNIDNNKKSFLEKMNEDLNMIDNNPDASLLNDQSQLGKLDKQSLHLIILVHGFQGNSHDMRLIKNTISLISPGCVLLPSCSNQEDTECDLIDMGKKLANEVKGFLKDWNEGSVFNKISFIGHSIGGLIIRAALPFLSEYSSKMWLYMSLSSPHLGYIYSNSKLIDAGIWFLKTWKKSKSLEQLSLSDTKDLKESCIFKLSAMEGFNWFSHIFLLSSHQDLYAPYESTRIQLCDQSFTDNYRADVYRSMAYNILSKITTSNLRRVDVNFTINEKNLDSFIGRTAHIQFLENVSFMKILFYSIEGLLK